MKKLVKILGFLVLGICVLIGAGLIYVKVALPDVGPPPDLKVELTKERVERGEHLANNVMLCMHCHSSQEKTKFSHPIKNTELGMGGTKFSEEEGLPGNFYAPNLTPYHLGGWSDGEIFRAVTSGVSKDDRALFPIMPYPNYAQIDKEDIYSIIAYLRTLESIENDVPVSEPSFPMNFIVNTIPAKAEFKKIPKLNDRVAYGKYLVTAASCGDCHTPMDKGTPKTGMEFAGGNEFVLADKSVVRTSNLTPDTLTGIGSWTEDAFVTRFKIYADSTFIFHEVRTGEFNTAMPWKMYSNMSEEELKAIYAYLKTQKPVRNLVTRFTPATE